MLKKVRKRPTGMYPAIFFILYFLSFIMIANAQVKRTGLPLINNFPRSIYKASTQNWAIVQNEQGFVYFANNDGLLEFDGQHWATFPVPNNSIIRSVLAANDTIYAGAFEEFGYYAPDHRGKLLYHSLLHLVPQEFRSFDEIWKIHRTKEGVFFQSFKYVFLWHNNTIQTFEPKESFGHSYSIGEDLYIASASAGLLRYKQGNVEVISDDEAFSNNEVRCILPFENGKLLIGFINKGLFVFDGKTLTPWVSDVSKAIENNSIFSAIRLRSGFYAFGTIQNGVFIANDKGEILQHINRYKGMLNNTVLSLFEDKRGNLWLGLDNGIDYLEINSPLSIFDHTFHIESTYASAVYDGNLYVGTNQGLFYAQLDALDNNQSHDTGFEIIPGTEGQVWRLEIIDNKLLCGHNFGLFHIKGNQATRIAADRGYWSFIQHNGNPDTLICGTYNGLTILVKTYDSWRFLNKMEGFDESSRTIVQVPEDQVLWMAHGYRGLFRLKLSQDLKKVEEYELFDGIKGLPAELPYNVIKIQNDLIFNTKDGFFEYQKKKGVFEPSLKYNKIFNENQGVDNIYADDSGNLWYFASGKMSLMRLIEDGTYSNITAPFERINNSLIEAYENVFVYDNRNVFIGSKNGLLHYDPFYRKDYRKTESVVFREIIFSGSDSSLMYFNVNSKSVIKQIKIPYQLNSISFRYSNPFFEGAGNTLFSFRMAGFDQNWSDWDRTTFKEYTNLPEGKYTFEVKASSLNTPDENVARFEFVIQPPFYRSILAYVLYVVLLIAIVIGNVIFIQRRVAQTKQEEKERHSKELREQESGFREQALQAEKEIINLRNESLQAQVSHKNKELANTTLHLIHKNKILNAIKLQLNGLIDNNLAQTKRTQVEQLVNKINKELKNEKFQQVFDEYFDDVHQDFISRLKEKHPELSPRELRLCAYLKMNLSTKEIAPLMNISIRGVEIGRYRLRKKLDLDREENLIDYLFRF